MISLELTAGDLLDRLTILEIRLRRISGEAQVRKTAAALERARAARRAAGIDTPALAFLVEDLRQINRALWDAEDEIRDRERQEDLGPGFVAVARTICHLNDRRAALKRSIDELCGFAASDEKTYGVEGGRAEHPDAT